MPIYEYICHDCELKFEVQKLMINRAKADCPQCGQSAEKVMSMTNFTFGWQLTDASSKRFGPRDQYERAV